MRITSKFRAWALQREERVYRDRERKLARENHLSRNNGLPIINKTIESYIAPPTFLLYLWACLPLLFLSTLEIKSGIAGIVATIINFFLIHRDMDNILRYIASGVVLGCLVLLYHFRLI